MTRNKIISILLVALLFAILSACGTGNINSPTNQTGQTGPTGGPSSNPTTTTTGPTSTQPPATGAATLGWAAPTTNTDGTPLTDLAGYKIYYGTSSGNYTKVINAGNVTSYTVNDLPAGTYYFAVTTYDAQNIESGYSGEVTKTI